MTDPMMRAHDLLDELYKLFEKITDGMVGPTPVVHNNRKKLTKRDVVVIRSMKRNGVSQRDIADAFDVNAATISRIIRGHYWK